MMFKVLLVDDNYEFRDFLKWFLLNADLNIKIYEAPTGEMGVASALFHKTDVVLMDVRLPNTNGIQAAKMIKREYPECEIIILTMFLTEEIWNIKQEGAISYIIDKSEVYDRLIPAIKNIFKSKAVLT